MDNPWLYYTAADVCIIPSRYEPFGSAAIAALAYKIPIVASDVDGCRRRKQSVGAGFTDNCLALFRNLTKPAHHLISPHQNL
ncbi:MAG: glycosyltransferase [Coleofasciculus sp. G2-EDA-02]